MELYTNKYSFNFVNKKGINITIAKKENKCKLFVKNQITLTYMDYKVNDLAIFFLIYILEKV